jgi:hypothetical protein
VVRDVIRGLDLQSEMPGASQSSVERDPEPPSPPQLDEAPAWQIQIPEDVLTALLWTSVILGLLVIVWSLRDYMPMMDRSRALVADNEEGGPSAEGNKMEVAQIEADELAGNGRFVEAMHLLLLQSLVEMRKRLDVKIADSLTSREILRMSCLSALASASLASIIGDVERTYFGRQSAVAEDYLTCRRHFDQLKLSLQNGAAA